MTHGFMMPRMFSGVLAAAMALPACAQAPQPTAAVPPTAVSPTERSAATARATEASASTRSSASPASPPPPQPTAAQQQAYGQCLQRLRGSAQSAGVSAATLDRHLSGLQPDMGVLELLDRQPEFTTPIWDYLAGLVDEERVADGKAMLATHAGTLAQVERQYGVDPATVVAVWGVESDYGKTFGKRPLLVSLSTLSCFGRRQDFFRGELLATLKILERGDVDADNLRGSWAGAFGHTQFMPTTYERIAVDFDGDGRRDLVGSIPDALASTANYLKRSNWRGGEPWGYEVQLPSGFDTGLAGRTNRRPLSDWLGRGIARVDGGRIDLPGSTRAAVLLPAGRGGPAFLVFRNFDAIYSYNAAESYALAIAHLSDRLRGGGPFVQAWPTDDPGLSRAQRRELQQLLLARGHAIGEVDGIIGSASRAAIQVEQRRLGQAPADGRGGSRILEALRADAGTAD
jgi:lytic murein transglycosylase